MIQRALPWLPPAPAGGFERQLARLVEDWSAHWIRSDPSLTVEPARLSKDPMVAWYDCPGIAVGARTETLVALAQAALAGHADLGNNRDCEILADVGRQALLDLASRIGTIADPDTVAEYLPTDSPGDLPPSYRVVGPAWALEIALDIAAQVRLRRHLAGERRRPVLANLADALIPEKVGLGCHLGEASLSTGDVTALAPGDLIVLDRRISDPLPLTVEGTVAAKGKVSVEAADGILSIRVADTIDLAAGSD